VSEEKVALVMALRRVMKQAGFPVRADFIAWAKTSGWHQLNDKTFQGLFGASNLRSATREMAWHTVAQVVTYSCQHSPHLNTERELPRMAGFWQHAYGRVPDGYSGRIITPTPGDIALLCGKGDPAELDTAHRQAAELSRQITQLNTDMALLSEQVSDRNEQILQLRRHLERAETGKAAVEGTAAARQEALKQLRAQLAEAHHALEADDQRLSDVHGELQKVQHRATNATAAAFTLDVDTPPDWSARSHPNGDRLRRLRNEPAPTTATPGLRILARHLLEHAIEHGDDLDKLVATANISPEVIEPLLTAALLPGRDMVLAVAAKCGADLELTARLYEQAHAEQHLRKHAENPAENLAKIRVIAGENPIPPAGNPARMKSGPPRPAAPDHTAGSHPGSRWPTSRRIAIAVVLILILVAAIAASATPDTDDPPAAANATTISTQAATSSPTPSSTLATSTPTPSSAPATPTRAITGHGDGGNVIVSRDGRRRAAVEALDNHSGFQDGMELRVWDVKTGKRVRTFGFDDSAARIALSSDGSYLAAIVVVKHSRFFSRFQLYTLYVWNVVTGDQVIKRYIDRQVGSAEGPPLLTRSLTLKFLKGTTLLSSNDVNDDDSLDGRLALTNAANGDTIGRA
jgi:hypothetical protein